MRGNESRENYLETILILLQEIGNVRSIDIARRMEYSKPSVSKAMSNLKRDNLIIINENGFIKLTPQGEKLANDIYERHLTITHLLCKIGVSEKIASEDACRIEHCISEETFNKMKTFLYNN